MKVDLTIAGMKFENVELPDADSPLPPTNATIHIKDHELGYGTPNRVFIAICGERWTPADCGQHKSVCGSETYWFKHVNCSRCLEKLSEDSNHGL